MQTYVFTVAVTGSDAEDVQDEMDTQAIAEMVRDEVIAFYEGQNANRSEPVHYDVQVTPSVRVTH